MNDVLRIINEKNITAGQLKLSPDYLMEIIKLVDARTINTSTGKSLLTKVEESGEAPGEIVETEGLAQVSDDSAIRNVCEQVLAENPNQVASFRGGKETLIGWFVGQVMRRTRGKANPNMARSILEELLFSE
jgi:aspartyl-tRNA(Asn)/glutamyl-tRNA(Gln) amidotransferase subunit B